jgi:hypothetical protein
LQDSGRAGPALKARFVARARRAKARAAMSFVDCKSAHGAWILVLAWWRLTQ